MNYCVFAVILDVLAFQAGQNKPKDPDTTRVSLKVENTSLQKVLQLLRADSGSPIELDEAASKQVNLEEQQISISVDKTVLTGVLKLIFGPRGREITVVDKKKVLIVVKGP